MLYAQAQDSTKVSQKITKQFTKEAEPERMTWEIGTDIYPLLSTSSGRRTSIFVRKNVTKLKGLNEVYRAYRFRIGLNSNIHSVDTLNSASNSRIQSFNPFLTLGYEYQQQMGKWQLFYGSDVSFSYFYENYESPRYYYSNVGNVDLIGVEYRKITSYNLGISPFIGMKYFVHPRFAISLEGSFLISYSSYYKFVRVVTSKVILDNTSNGNSIGTEVNPISVFNLSYLF
jgi:hypothetical protein